MGSDMPRLDKKQLTVSSLDGDGDEKEYWHSRTPEERLNALELYRRMVYGEDATSSRLQRVLEVADLERLDLKDSNQDDKVT